MSPTHPLRRYNPLCDETFKAYYPWLYANNKNHEATVEAYHEMKQEGGPWYVRGVETEKIDTTQLESPMKTKAMKQK